MLQNWIIYLEKFNIPLIMNICHGHFAYVQHFSVVYKNSSILSLKFVLEFCVGFFFRWKNILVMNSEIVILYYRQVKISKLPQFFFGFFCVENMLCNFCFKMSQTFLNNAFVDCFTFFRFKNHLKYNNDWSWMQIWFEDFRCL